MEHAPVPRWVNTADQLAAALLEAARPLRFEPVRTPSELEAVFRLRYRTVVQRGWRRPEELADGLERDEYDDGHAVQLAAWDGTTLVGCARVVYPVPGRRLPTEAAFDVTIPAARAVDAGRLIVAPERREGRNLILGGLAASIWLAMNAGGYHWAAVAVTPRMMDRCRSLGFEVVTMGPPRRYWGEERIPVLLSPPDPHAWDDSVPSGFSVD